MVTLCGPELMAWAQARAAELNKKRLRTVPLSEVAPNILVGSVRGPEVIGCAGWGIWKSPGMQYAGLR